MNQYDENFLMIQRLEARKIQNLFSQSSLISTPTVQTSKMKKDTQYIHQERAVLDHQLTNIIQLDLCQFHYLEVQIYGHKKPLILYFTFCDQTKMKFYVSSHTITPNRFNNEEAFERKQILRYTEQGDSSSFTQRCLYLAIFSQQATTISIKIAFGIKTDNQFRKNTESTIRPSTGYQFIRSSQFYEFRKPTKDMIALNKNLQQYDPQLQKQQMELRRVQSAKRFQITQNKKKQIYLDKKESLKEKFDNLEKRKLIKEILNVINLVRNQYYKSIKFQFEASIKKRRQFRAQQAIKRMLEKHGQTLQQRTIFYGLMNLKMLARFKAQQSKKKARKIVTSFMMSYGQIGEIFQKTYQFKRRMKLIIEIYRNYKKKVLAYITRIIMLWNKYWHQIYTEIKQEDQEQVNLIKQQMAKTIINYTIEEEIIKSPYLDIKAQQIIVQNYYKETKTIFTKKWRVFKSKTKASRVSILATQAFDKGTDVLFPVVNKLTIKKLIHKYMEEKGMIQSLLMKK